VGGGVRGRGGGVRGGNGGYLFERVVSFHWRGGGELKLRWHTYVVQYCRMVTHEPEEGTDSASAGSLPDLGRPFCFLQYIIKVKERIQSYSMMGK
jgi:hypothetical protein